VTSASHAAISNSQNHGRIRGVRNVMSSESCTCAIEKLNHYPSGISDAIFKEQLCTRRRATRAVAIV
jgi:hypothetical protein